MAQFEVGGPVTYAGGNTALLGRVGLVVRIDPGEIAVDFGRTDEPILRCHAQNLIARDADPSPQVGNYCRPCGENLLPEQTECPFCGQMATPVDDLVITPSSGCVWFDLNVPCEKWECSVCDRAEKTA